MNGISENTRYIASYLKLHEDEFLQVPHEHVDYLTINEEKLAELLQEYFDNRR